MVEKEFLFQTVNNGAFSVDTFFFIRLVVFLMLLDLKLKSAEPSQ